MANDGRTQIVLSAVDKTKQAFNSAKRNIEDLKGAGDGLALRFGSIGIAIAGAFEAVSLKHLIDSADELSKLEQKTGIAVESLTALKYAGDLSDVSIEDLAGGLKKLAVNMSAAAGGGKEQQATFAAIGVSVKTATGALRNTDDVLGDVADKFESFADGPEKAALAVALFGKSGDKMIPFLNAGRKGLADMRDEAQKLGVVFGSDLAKQAEAFNDNLTRIKTGLEGAKVAILGDMLPALNRLLSELIEGRKAFGSFGAALVELGIRSRAFESYGEGAQAARDQIALLNDQLERLKRNKPPEVIENAGGAAFTGPRQRHGGSPDAERQLNEEKARAEKRLAYFKALQMQEALALGEGVVDTNARLRQPGKNAAPVVDKDAAANAEALLRKQLDGRLQALKDGLDKERDLLANANTQLADAFANGEMSIDQFYDAKQKAQLDYLVAQQAGFDAEIKAWEAYRAKVAKPQEKQEATNAIAKIIAEQGKAFRESGQAAEKDEKQRIKGTEDYRKSLVALDAQINELSGDKFGAEQLRNAQQLDEARKLLEKGGDDPKNAKRLTDLDALLKRQAQYNDLQDKLSLLNERQAVAEEAYLVTARARGDGLLQQEAEIQAMRQKSVNQLQVLADETAALAKKDPRMALWADQLGLALAKAKENLDPTLARVRSATDEFGNAIGDAVEDVLVNFHSLDDVFNGLLKTLDRLVVQTLLIDPLKESAKGFLKSFAPSITDFIKGGSGASAGTAAAGAAATAATTATTTAATATADAGLAALASTAITADASLLALADAAASAAVALAATASAGGGKAAVSGAESILAMFKHTGGVVGQGGNSRYVPAAAFAGALHYRTGGIAGLAPDEVPAVLHRGEEVLTQGDPRHRDNGGMQPSKVIHLNVNVSAAPGMTKQTATQQGAAAGRAARAALARND